MKARVCFGRGGYCFLTDHFFIFVCAQFYFRVFFCQFFIRDTHYHTIPESSRSFNVISQYRAAHLIQGLDSTQRENKTFFRILFQVRDPQMCVNMH